MDKEMQKNLLRVGFLSFLLLLPSILLANRDKPYTHIHPRIAVLDGNAVGKSLKSKGVHLAELVDKEIKAKLLNFDACLLARDFSCLMRLYDRKRIERKFFPKSKGQTRQQFENAWLAQLSNSNSYSFPLLVLYRLRKSENLKTLYWDVFATGFNESEKGVSNTLICAELKKGKIEWPGKDKRPVLFVGCFEREKSSGKMRFFDPSPFWPGPLYFEGHRELDGEPWPYYDQSLIKSLKG